MWGRGLLIALPDPYRLPDDWLALPFNHCNLPARYLACLAFQLEPVALQLDGVHLLYADLFERLDACLDARARRRCFIDFMAVRFHLPAAELPEVPAMGPVPRPRLHYGQLLLGWLFDSDNQQGAIWRQWVESRFGLCTRFYKEPITGPDDPAYGRFLHTAGWAGYNSNALYDQLDLLYSFCQYQLVRDHPLRRRLTLYRGGTERPTHSFEGQPVMLLNNLCSCTDNPEEAFRFGPRVYALAVPLPKIVCYQQLLPSVLQGEGEYMVLGGCYPVTPVA